MTIRFGFLTQCVVVVGVAAIVDVVNGIHIIHAICLIGESIRETWYHHTMIIIIIIAMIIGSHLMCTMTDRTTPRQWPAYVDWRSVNQIHYCSIARNILLVAPRTRTHNAQMIWFNKHTIHAHPTSGKIQIASVTHQSIWIYYRLHNKDTRKIINHKHG